MLKRINHHQTHHQQPYILNNIRTINKLTKTYQPTAYRHPATNKSKTFQQATCQPTASNLQLLNQQQSNL